MNNNDVQAQHSSVWMVVGYGILMAALVLLACLFYYGYHAEYGWPPLSLARLAVYGLSGWLALGILCPLLLMAWDGLARMRAAGALGTSVPWAPRQAPVSSALTWPGSLRGTLRQQYGPLWRHKVRVVLVTGEPEQIEAVAPTLAAQHWLEAEGVLLLHGGSLQSEPAAALVQQWRKLCPRRPFDAIVWALSAEQSATPVYLDTGL
ncbi:type VI secretion protein VasK, partial [Pseudomonas sp. NPDC007930]